MELEDFILNTLKSIGNINFSFLSVFLGIVFIIFSLVIIGWVWVDASERTSKTKLILLYTCLAIFLNIPGLIIYLIIRPSETIEDIYWTDLERRYLKFETAELGDCPKCGEQLFPGLVFCPKCGFRIKRKCPKCGVLINKNHKYCEYCGFQLKDRAQPSQKYPDVKKMEEQITATKKIASTTVESKRTRYKTGDSFVTALGSAIITSFLQVKKIFTKKDTTEEDDEVKHEEIKREKRVKVEKSKKKNKKK